MTSNITSVYTELNEKVINFTDEIGNIQYMFDFSQNKYKLSGEFTNWKKINIKNTKKYNNYTKIQIYFDNSINKNSMIFKFTINNSCIKSGTDYICMIIYNSEYDPNYNPDYESGVATDDESDYDHNLDPNFDLYDDPTDDPNFELIIKKSKYKLIIFQIIKYRLYENKLIEIGYNYSSL